MILVLNMTTNIPSSAARQKESASLIVIPLDALSTL
jgi:hypothetical protein